MFINEGGNAVTQNGDEAGKVEIKDFTEEQYEAFKQGIIDVVSEMSAAYKKKSGHPLFSQAAIDSRDIFAGSCNCFFKKSMAEYTKYKPKMGDIDVQVNKDDIDSIRDFLNENIGKKFAGWTYLGYQKVALVYCNVFAVPKFLRPQAGNVQIDFNFVPYKDGAPEEFSVFAHNSDWADLEQNIKGFAKNTLLPIFFNVIYARPGVLFTAKGNKLAKNQPEDIHTKSYGYNGSREKYQQVMGDDGKPIMVDGKPAYREMPTSATKQNTDLNSIFKEMFGKEPTAKERQKMWSFVGVLDLMEKYLTKAQISKIYQRYKKALADQIKEQDKVEIVLDKFKEKFNYCVDLDECTAFQRYFSKQIIGE